MSEHYILDGKEAKAVDLLTWATWLESNSTRRHVKDERVGDVRVSTVFLGLDHQYGNGPPLLFETMVFGGALDGDQDRYTTWEQAEAGHAAMVARVKSSPPESD